MKSYAEAPSQFIVKQTRPNRCLSLSGIQLQEAGPSSSMARTGSGCLLESQECAHVPGLVIIPCCSTAHTGYQTGKHSGNRSHSLSRQQGEEQHDLTLPAQNETGKRLLGSGGQGRLSWDRSRRDDEAPMWGTGRTPAGLHVHTIGLSYIAIWSEKSPAGVLVAGSIHLPLLIP